MKYIRTKDGIYELMPNIEQDYEVSFDSKTLEPAYYTINHEWVAKKDVIKQADTIEELCDLFVDTTGLKGIADGWRFDGYDKSKKALWWISTSETTRYIPISEWNDKTVIKGAIWTDKGLIYVAKMNEKGELELL